ncbi:SGNH/GDSL hydrolase family protein [Rhodocytophaga aerolata]|uniref:SGNH/GDSL hydrolase family protein n=1 Tax=Rhodocytophaga aerolata TaxID=455078 RepID=A0ABT8RIA2_9BACT|nr:SGNH/GDSL hydrolase family protein [Rhodocytophaga aerolata]MDO1450898.1 SGNH/GDSL hydrolase family protein [Rhodocytophaga aerolata]
MEDKQTSNRRSFIKTASLGSVLALSIPDMVKDVFEEQKVNKVTLSTNDTILFQGDSITDAGRKKEEKHFNSAPALGSGYAFLAAAELLHKYPGKQLKIYNRGISGNKVYQLAERWEEDCLAIQPTVLSILIGVNDHWHVKRNGYTGTLKTYQDDYKALLDRTKQKLPDIKLIIGEPFGVAGIKGNYEIWESLFNDYQKAAQDIASTFGAVFIPYQRVFDKAIKSAPREYWTYDGVHTTLAGAKLMAQAWTEAVKG